MAVYKVPQNVEAEDKLLGPFSFRQFIYLIIASLAGFMAFMLFQVLPPLVVIPLPILVVFLVLALPLRKDQPMETYLLAVVRFFLKPRFRFWSPEGTISYVEITAPKVQEPQLAKAYGADTAQERLGSLARLMDTRGWSARGVSHANDAVQLGVVNEAADAEDVLDQQAEVAQAFEQKLQQQEAERREKLMSALKEAPKKATNGHTTQSKRGKETDLHLDYNPYPTNMHQKVLDPLNPEHSLKHKKHTKKEDTPTTSKMTEAVSPDIIRLANNNNVSITTLAKEANRLKENEFVEVKINH